MIEAFCLPAYRQRHHGAETVLRNPSLDYQPIADLVIANIRGGQAASAALNEVHGQMADPDLLYLSLKSLLPDNCDTEALTKIRGYMRQIQRAIERSAA